MYSQKVIKMYSNCFYIYGSKLTFKMLEKLSQKLCQIAVKMNSIVIKLKHKSSQRNGNVSKIVEKSSKVSKHTHFK